MARRTLELPLAADRDDPEPLTSQLAGQLRDAMADGRLATGERLPSTRTLAGLLEVSRTVVTAAYAQLFAEGWVEGRHGSGTFVADGAPGRPAKPGQPEPVLPPGTGRGTRRHLDDRPAARDRVDSGDRPRGVAPCLAERGHRDHR
jgi:GntR family transcriptional regulator/MocR family aminotransferase